MAKLNRYVVRWTIDVEAATEERAARKAAAAHRRRGSIATVYEVAEEGSQFYKAYDVAEPAGSSEEIACGDRVTRVSSDYTNGRVGIVIEINAAGRLRVAWEGHARTWVKPSCVVKLRSNE